MIRERLEAKKGVKPDGSQPVASDAQSPGSGANPAPYNTKECMKNLSNKVLVQLVADPRDIRWYEYQDELLRRLEERDKYRAFFESCSCLYADGAEFMTKTEIYEAIKKEVKRLESSEPRPV